MTSKLPQILVRGDILYENTVEHLDKLGINLDMPAITDEEAENEEFALGQGQGPSGTLAAADVLPRFRITENDHVEVDIMDSAFSGEFIEIFESSQHFLSTNI